MGMYDIVSIMCPKCSKITEFQSKAGECELRSYSLLSAPLSIIADLNDDGVRGKLFCEACGVQLRANVSFSCNVVVADEVSTETRSV